MYKLCNNFRRQDGSGLLLAIMLVGVMSIVAGIFTQCTDEVMLSAKLRERRVREQLFVTYLKGATDCRETIMRNGGICNGAPMTLYSRTGKSLPESDKFDDFDPPVVTCIREETIDVPTDEFPNFAKWRIPEQGLPSRERYDAVRRYRHQFVSPIPDLNVTRWNLWFSLSIKYRGSGSIPEGSLKRIYHHRSQEVEPLLTSAVGWYTFNSDSDPWVCDDGIELWN